LPLPTGKGGALRPWSARPGAPPVRPRRGTAHL